MARGLPRASPKTRIAQLELPLDGGSGSPNTSSVAQLSEAEWAAVTSTAEILPPTPTTLAPTPLEPFEERTDGQKEHEFLLSRSAKYEDRCFRAVQAFGIFALLTLLAKAGIAVSESLTAERGIPLPDDTRLLPGILASLTIICAVVSVYYALRIEQHRPQRHLRLVGRSWVGHIAQAMLFLCVGLLALVFAVIVYVAVGDVAFMATYIFDHIFYVMDGWDATIRPPAP